MAKKDLMKAVQNSSLVSGDANQALQNMGVLKPKEEDPETRATFIIKQSIQHKVKVISALEKRQIKDVVNEIFTQYIENWEMQNGKTIEL